jgi:hypothetical protein
MSDMMHVLGLAVTGGKYGSIRMFKECQRFCKTLHLG